MNNRLHASLSTLRISLVLFAMAMPAASFADDGDPPTRVARLAYAEGSVSLQPGGTDDWVTAPLNRPLTGGDKLWSDRDGRVELQLDGSLLRMSGETSVSILNLDDNTTQIELSQGTLLVRVRRLDDDETYEIDTPNLAFSVLRPGLYRVRVDDSGNTIVRVDSGQGEVTGGGAAYQVRAHEDDVFSGSDTLSENTQAYSPNEDDFDYWSTTRDERWANSPSAAYVSSDVVGYEDLDSNGDWSTTPEYAHVWFPRGIDAGWAPYHLGHWSYIAPWGYTWVDDQPWGFAPFHYGRWVSIQGSWGWIPSPPRTYDAIYVRPVYAPALVAWVGVGAGVAWFALGPREVYVPSYPVSRRYVDNINISNTRVNTTVINNVYNTTIINNKTVNVTNINYVNRNIPGAVAATTSQAFASAQPVGRNAVNVGGAQIRGARVQAFAPALVPTKLGVLGAARISNVRPPEAIQSRGVVARIAPPAPPPAFESRQAAIRSNGGRPLSVAEQHTIQAPTRPAQAVRIAPPATPAAARPVERVADRPPVGAAPVTQPSRPLVHANDLPQTPRPPSPAEANSVLERQHLQEQQQLRTQQAAEQQRVEQQQNAEHAQLARQQADANRQKQLQMQQQQQQQQASQNAERQQAQQRELEQQHQQQTAALAQQREQAQRELIEKQQEQRRQLESKPKPANHGPEPAPRP